MGTSHGLFTCEALLQIWAGNPVRFQGILTAEEKVSADNSVGLGDFCKGELEKTFEEIEAKDAEWEQVV